MLNLQNVSPKTWTRTIALFLCIFNHLMNSIGHPILDIDDMQIEQFVNEIIDIVSAVVYIWSWWKDNPFTAEAQEAHTAMKLKKLTNQLKQYTEEGEEPTSKEE